MEYVRDESNAKYHFISIYEQFFLFFYLVFLHKHYDDVIKGMKQTNVQRIIHVFTVHLII